MVSRKYRLKSVSFIFLLVFVFSFIIPIPKTKAANYSKLANAIINLNKGSKIYKYTTDNRVWEVIVEPTKVNDYKSEFKNPQDKCNSSLKHIYWTWDSTYARQVRTSDISYKTPVSPYVQGGGGLTYKTSTLLLQNI